MGDGKKIDDGVCPECDRTNMVRDDNHEWICRCGRKYRRSITESEDMGPGTWFLTIIKGGPLWITQHQEKIDELQKELEEGKMEYFENGCTCRKCEYKNYMSILTDIQRECDHDFPMFDWIEDEDINT